jgi:hypothetical protein
MNMRYKISRMVMFAMATLVAASVGAANPEAAAATPTREMRSQMAAVHEKAAACLRSDKPVAECHKEMMDGCRAVGAHGCPMMDRKMEHGGMRPGDVATGGADKHH